MPRSSDGPSREPGSPSGAGLFGSRTFLAMWLGEVASVTGTQLTAFALGVWAFQQTGSVTWYSSIVLTASAPQVLLTPLAGVLVDRHPRRSVLMAGHAGAGVCSLVMAVLFVTGALRLWHVPVLVAASSVLSTAQYPAFQASVSLLVPTAHLARAAGLVHLGFSVVRILAPAAAGALMPHIRLGGILAVDVVTFVFAIALLSRLRIPHPSRAPTSGRFEILRNVRHGWAYIRSCPGLTTFMLLFAAMNFCLGMALMLVTPLVLGFADERVLGGVMSTAGTGMLLGSLLLLTWGGPRRLVRGIFVCAFLQALLVAAAGLRPSAVLITVALFGALLLRPLLSGCSAAVWQQKVAPELQGRVFAIRSATVQGALPLSYLVAGPLVDKVFEPLAAGMSSTGPGAVVFVGGPGRGVALMFLVLGGLLLAAVTAGYLHPRLRHLEENLPNRLA